MNSPPGEPSPPDPSGSSAATAGPAALDPADKATRLAWKSIRPWWAIIEAGTPGQMRVTCVDTLTTTDARAFATSLIEAAAHVDHQVGVIEAAIRNARAAGIDTDTRNFRKVLDAVQAGILAPENVVAVYVEPRNGAPS